MPDNVPPLTSQNQIDWHAMLHDLEKSVEVMSDAIDGVRIAVRRLVMAEAWLPPITVETPAAVPADAFEPVADQMAGIAVPPPIAAEVHAAAAEMAPPPTAEETEATRDLVQRFVDEVREEPAVPPAPQAPVQDDEAAREAALRAVEQAKAEFAGQPPAFLHEAVAPAQSPDDEDAREAVRRAVEQARAELAGGAAVTAQRPALPPEEEMDAREAVRRAVEEARAEIASGHASETDGPAATRVLPQRPVNPMHLLPTLTIEDHEARVELPRVYALLQALGVASQASLLNYTSRQVSVMLGADAARFTPDDFAAAVRQTMGRQSTVQIDDANVLVHLGVEANAGKEEAA